MNGQLRSAALRRGLVLALAICSTALMADSPAGASAPVVFSGPITEVSASSLTVQGVAVGIMQATFIKGIDPGTGLLVDLTPETLQVGDGVTVFAEDVEGTASAELILRGMGFKIRGQVTAVQTDGSGKPQVVVDGIYTVNVGQTTFLGGGAMSHRKDGAIQVGSEVSLWGIVSDGVFTAAFGTMEGAGSGGAEPTMDNGFILNLTTDGSGAVTGFTMSSRHSVETIVFSPSTVIQKGGTTVDASALGAGMHVKVWGTSQADGSVLASQVLVKGGMRH